MKPLSLKRCNVMDHNNPAAGPFACFLEPSPAAPRSGEVVWPLRNGHTITFTPTYRGRPGYRLCGSPRWHRVRNEKE